MKDASTEVQCPRKEKHAMSLLPSDEADFNFGMELNSFVGYLPSLTSVCASGNKDLSSGRIRARF